MIGVAQMNGSVPKANPVKEAHTRSVALFIRAMISITSGGKSASKKYIGLAK